MGPKNLEEIEIDLLLEAVFQAFGYDFRNYARQSMVRRLENLKATLNFRHYSEMIHRALHDSTFIHELIRVMSISVTEMFRDPACYLTFRKNIIPVLKTYPYLKIWNAGCATGEEAYATAIVLQEENISSRFQIYATDFNSEALTRAEKGLFQGKNLPLYTENYQASGGRFEFSRYYTVEGHEVVLDPKLRKNLLFTYHNLATDGSFGEMNMIFCRNVMIYFNKDLQNRVLNLFADSLCEGGYLCLGPKESLEFTEVERKFETVHQDFKIYRKKNG